MADTEEVAAGAQPWAISSPELAPRPEPSFMETVAAGAKSSVVGSALYQPSLIEAIMPSNTAPVSDAEIEQRLLAENMTDYIANFTAVQTQGELDAKIKKIAYERDNAAILSASDWGSWVVAKAVEGILDPAVLIPASVGVKVGLAGGSLVKQTAAFAAGGGVAGGLSHLEQAALQETTEVSLPSLLAATGAGLLAGGLIGLPIAKYITAKEATALGNAVRTDLSKLTDGTLERDASALATKVTDTTVDVIRNPSAYQSEAKALAKMLGEEPSPSQIALARSLGMDKLSRAAVVPFGRSIPLEMMASDFGTAKEFAANMFMIRGSLTQGGEQMTNPVSVWAMTGEINGIRDNARKDLIEAWKEWAADNANYTALERFLPSNQTAGATVSWMKQRLNLADHDVSLRAFSDLVTKAIIHAPDSGLHVEGDLAELLAHPAVQRAVQSYRKFDDQIADRTVKAGLMSRDSLMKNHIHRVYTDQARADAPRLEAMEAQHHFTKTWDETKQEAWSNWTSTAEKLRKDYSETLEKLTDEEARLVEKRATTIEDTFGDRVRQKVDAEIKKLHANLFGRRDQDGLFIQGRLQKELDQIEREVDAEYQAALKGLTKPDTKEFRAERVAEVAKLENELKAARTRAVKNATAELADDPAALQAKLANIEKFYTTRLANVDNAASKLSRTVTRQKYQERLEGLREYYNSLHAERLAAAQAEMQATFERRAATIESELDPQSIRGRKALQQKRKDVTDAERATIEEINARRKTVHETYAKAFEDADNAFFEATSLKARFAQEEASKNHANGVVKAILFGETGNGGGNRGGVPSSGNIAGARKERNVMIPDHVLVANGWIDTDLLSLVNQQARSEGMASVVAMKFRRKMTDDEAIAMRNNPKAAYWRDGHDPETVPDLAMTGVREAIVKEALQKGADLEALRPLVYDTTMLDGLGMERLDVTEAMRIANHAKQMLAYVDEAAATVLGTHTQDFGAKSWNSTVGFLKAWNFASTLGLSAITNTTDAFKAMAHHGFGNFMEYSAARWAERLADEKFLRGQSTKELRDMAGALGFGLEKYSQQRLSGMLDAFDPYARSEGANYLEGAANALSKVGGNLFLLNQWNNMMKSAAYGMAQFRLSKIALADAAKLSDWDKSWIREIGIRQSDLVKIKEQLNAQGITSIKGSETGRIKLDAWTDELTKSRFLAAMNKDVTTNSIQPNMGNTPRLVARNPVAALFAQFMGFTMEAMQALSIRTGQQFAQGQSKYAAQMVGFLLAGATAQYMLKGFARGDLDARMKSFERQPGQLAYNIMDNTGVLAPITMVNNMFEDVTGFGLRRTFGALAGDRGTLLSTSGRSEARGAGISAIAGSFGKQFDTVFKDVLPATLNGKFNEDTRRKLDRVIPFNNALPGMAATRAMEFTQHGFDAFRKTRGARDVFEGIIPGNEFLFSKQKF